MDPNQLLHTLRILETTLHQPHIRGDAVRLGELLHPRFREFGRSGKEYSRNNVLTELPAQRHAPEIISQDYQLELLAAGLALLTYRSAYVAASGVLEHHTRRASLWELTEAGWQLRFHQGTPTEAFTRSAN